MKTIIKLFVLAAMLVGPVASASAQATGSPDFRPYSREGEISPHTQAPTREQLMNAIDVARRSSPVALQTLLEYGERVECHECVPLLEQRMLDPREDARVREMAAWWLRRRPFGFGAIMAETRAVLESDPDPARRAVAADAIGEFMDPHGVAHLGRALTNDADVRVRVAAVRGLARINSSASLPFLSQALADANVEVQDAALRVVLHVNFFRDHEALLPLLASEEGSIRRRAALVIGTMDVEAAVPALAAMVSGDTDEMVRQSAAWALGRIGTADARAALREAQGTERSTRVLDAIEVAIRMR
ncbi:HEAT repeat domain-containing protein [Sandaracinus amylolyticus]|uniref:HEAT repeat protein n=1 Tax=Sandaracinus amylolyticus TaxID=927083 RepID=A0A0F6YIN8_9BACT|nr:HEAT repeat domain-containing protein [Sandaracinus amylolyticus]AKF05285.1 HEAT repeat protein [Sandaracinus amylolyticus]